MLKWISLAIGLILLGLVGKCAYDLRSDRIIARILRIPSPPPSIRNATCESWSYTDTLTTCVFDLTPAEFPLLLRGWRFEEQSLSGSSHDLSGGPRLGQPFTAATEYFIAPAEFEHGGNVRLVTNKERTRGQLDIYRE